jgi:signal transduction histidine kinase
MKLANKLILFLATISTVALGITGVFWMRREMTLTETAAREDLVTMGHALRPALVHIWRVHGSAPALAMLDYADERLQSHRKVTLRWVSAQEWDGDDERTSTARTDGRLHAYVPVRAADMPPGGLLLTMTLDSERQFIQSGARKVIPTVLGLVLVLSIVTLTTTRVLIDRPLRHLAAQAKRIGAGDLSVSVDLDPSSDVGAVGAEMNAMCARLLDEQRKVAAEHAAGLAILDQLRHADRLATVGQLGAGLAHELGTPLNVVAGRAKMIVSDPCAGDEARSCARIIVAQADRMTRLIRQLLDFARRTSSAKVRCDLVPIVRQTLTMLAPIARKRGVELSFEEPSTAELALVEQHQLEQVISNLVVNGLQATTGHGSITVAMKRARVRPPAELGMDEGEYLSIEVVDQGAGMSAQLLTRIFDPFFTTKAIGEGTGLGLSVAYGIARDHGGWIDAASEPGRGSRFAVHLPAVIS